MVVWVLLTNIINQMSQ